MDVIAGFNGEGDAEFEETLDCLNKSFWTKLHVFPFSVRKGTRAESLPELVPSAVIHERSRILRELSDATYRSFLQSQIGKTKDVILEKPWPKRAGVWRGHTENYLADAFYRRERRKPSGWCRGGLRILAARKSGQSR